MSSGFTEFQKRFRDLRRQGFQVERTQNGHYRITVPGRPGMVFTGGTPSDRRAWLNTQRDLRKTFGREA